MRVRKQGQVTGGLAGVWLDEPARLREGTRYSAYSGHGGAVLS